MRLIAVSLFICALLGAADADFVAHKFYGDIRYDPYRRTLTWKSRPIANQNGPIKAKAVKYVLSLKDGTMTDGKTTKKFSEAERANVDPMMRALLMGYAVESVEWFPDPDAYDREHQRRHPQEDKDKQEKTIAYSSR